jgi:hypothetical protein
VGSAEGEQVRKILAELAARESTGHEKAEVFQQFTSQLESATGGAWQAVRIPTTDGADAFLGRQGELVAFAPDGTVFRGRIGSYRPARGGIELDYSKLVKL